MREIVSRIVVYGFLVAVTAAVPVVEASDLTERERVVLMLSEYENLPPSPAWHALGSDIVSTLIEIYDDPSELGFRRVRALTVLGYFPADSRAVDVLANAAASPVTHGSSRRAAIATLATVDPVRATGLLRGVLAENDPLLREAAVNALAQCATAEARQLLADHEDPEGFVTRAVERALGAGPRTP